MLAFVKPVLPLLVGLGSYLAVVVGIDPLKVAGSSGKVAGPQSAPVFWVASPDVLGVGLLGVPEFAAATSAVTAPEVPANNKAMVAGESAAEHPGGHGGDYHGTSHAEEEGPPVNPLEFRTDLALWTAVVFVVLMVVLWKFAWGPIAAALDKREQQIAEHLASAEKHHEEAKALLEQYKQQLAAAEQEVQRMLGAGREEAERLAAEIIAKAQAEAEALHRRRLAELEEARREALHELGSHAAELAVELASRILRSQLDPQSHHRLMEVALEQLATVGASENTEGNDGRS